MAGLQNEGPAPAGQVPTDPLLHRYE